MIFTNWKRPNLDNEFHEIAKICLEQQIDYSTLECLMEGAQLKQLDDETWSCLKNTDSYQCDLSCAIKYANEQNYDIHSIIQQFKTNKSIEVPIVLEVAKNNIVLVTGNTKLVAASTLGIRLVILWASYRRLSEMIMSYVDIIIEAKLELGTQRISLPIAMNLSKVLITEIGLSYIDPLTITTTTKFFPGSGYPVGSVRRQKSDIGDLDIIVTSQITIKEIEKIPGVENVTGGSKQINFVYVKENIRRKVNIFVFLNPKTFGAALMHTSGPPEYNIRIRRFAKKNGMILSQNGLYDLDGNLIAGPTELSVQRAMGIKNREIYER